MRPSFSNGGILVLASLVTVELKHRMYGVFLLCLKVTKFLLDTILMIEAVNLVVGIVTQKVLFGIVYSTLPQRCFLGDLVMIVFLLVLELWLQ